MKWKSMKTMLTCKCGSERFTVLDESSPHRIAADASILRIQCVECPEFIIIEGYQNSYYNWKKN